MVTAQQKPIHQLRSIKHPKFKPYNFKEAEAFLSTRPNGEIVVRPSSQGTDHIAMTWRVEEGVYHHIDVVESDKPNAMSVGRVLSIGNEKFSDLDEIIATHIEPMSRCCQDVIHHERYVPGDIDQVNDWLRRQMQVNPNRVPYCLALNRERPGAFWLAFKMTNDKEPEKQVPPRFFPTVD